MNSYLDYSFFRNDIFVVPISVDYSSNSGLEQGQGEYKQRGQREDLKRGQGLLSMVFGNLVLYTDGRYSMVNICTSLDCIMFNDA